jgi:deltex-like protein
MDQKVAECGYSKGNNSIVCEKYPTLTVLQYSSQCLPVLQFSTKRMATNRNGLSYLNYLLKKVQCLVDEHFNHHAKEIKIYSSARQRKRRFTKRVILKPASTPCCSTIMYEAPICLNEINPLTYFSVACLHRYMNEECSICLNIMSYSINGHPEQNSLNRVVRLNACGHEFHEQCAIQMLSTSSLCPICRTSQAIIRGSMPSGSMAVEFDSATKCGGFEEVGTIVLHYEIPPGIQKMYHEEPGKAHDGATFTAYVPHTMEGIKLVHRLQEAFLRGLIFTVSTSRNTSQSGQIIWASVAHKTCLSGGPSAFGYPDPLFLQRCQHELDSLGIPS